MNGDQGIQTAEGALYQDEKTPLMTLTQSTQVKDSKPQNH